MTALRIGDVAKQVGVTTRTIRYYEELGLLGAGSEREKGAHRAYAESDVARLQELIRLRDLLGLTLEELVELAEAEEARADAARPLGRGSERRRAAAASSRRRCRYVERQLALVRSRRATLDEFAAELEAKLARLRRRRRELGRSR